MAEKSRSFDIQPYGFAETAEFDSLRRVYFLMPIAYNFHSLSSNEASFCYTKVMAF